MEIIAVKGGDTIKEKFKAMANEISTVSDATVESALSSFSVLEHESELAWQKMTQDIKLELTKMHRMVSDIDAIQSRSTYPLRFVFHTLAVFNAVVKGNKKNSCEQEKGQIRALSNWCRISENRIRRLVHDSCSFKLDCLLSSEWAQVFR